jgi:hypothetical protein
MSYKPDTGKLSFSHFPAGLPSLQPGLVAPAFSRWNTICGVLLRARPNVSAPKNFRRCANTSNVIIGLDARWQRAVAPKIAANLNPVTYRLARPPGGLGPPNGSGSAENLSANSFGTLPMPRSNI